MNFAPDGRDLCICCDPADEAKVQELEEGQAVWESSCRGDGVGCLAGGCQGIGCPADGGFHDGCDIKGWEGAGGSGRCWAWTDSWSYSAARSTSSSS